MCTYTFSNTAVNCNFVTMFSLKLFQNHSILQMKMIEELTLGNGEVIIDWGDLCKFGCSGAV